MKEKNYPVTVRIPNETREKLNELFPNLKIGRQIQQATMELYAIKKYSKVNCENP